MNNNQIKIVSPREDYLVIRILERCFPGASQYWDRNWCSAQVSIGSGPFHCHYGMHLFTFDLANFYQALKNLDAHLAGQAKFESVEKQLAFSVEGENKGHIQLSGRAQYDFIEKNCLHFQFGMDPANLPGMIEQLERVLENYPVVD